MPDEAQRQHILEWLEVATAVRVSMEPMPLEEKNRLDMETKEQNLEIPEATGMREGGTGGTGGNGGGNNNRGGGNTNSLTVA